MSEDYRVIQELLNQRADLNARLALIPYDGSPEVKEIGGKRYLYVRKRVAGKLTSTYVDVYSDELYQALLRSTREARQLKREIRKIEKSYSNWKNEGKHG